MDEENYRLYEKCSSTDLPTVENLEFTDESKDSTNENLENFNLEERFPIDDNYFGDDLVDELIDDRYR